MNERSECVSRTTDHTLLYPVQDELGKIIGCLAVAWYVCRPIDDR
jgi:hypothetical protein